MVLLFLKRPGEHADKKPQTHVFYEVGAYESRENKDLEFLNLRLWDFSFARYRIWDWDSAGWLRNYPGDNRVICDITSVIQNKYQKPNDLNQNGPNTIDNKILENAEALAKYHQEFHSGQIPRIRSAPYGQQEINELLGETKLYSTRPLSKEELRLFMDSFRQISIELSTK